jgi:hypothetical protein
MIVDVRCNITKYALQKLNSLRYGGVPPLSATLAIYENYIAFLNCYSTNYNYCYADPCISGPSTNNCLISIGALTTKITGDYYTISPINLTGIDNPPLIYQWIYDLTKWEAIGSTTTPILTLRLKGDPKTISTPIYLTITDVDGCTDTIECGLVAGNFICGAICSTISGLNIILQDACNGVTGLIIK